jgi:CBS domain-containing protein
VIAAGLAPDSCSVVRVMTPHPDTALPSTSILDALKKMHGNFCKDMLKNLFIMMINRWSLFEFTNTG